MAWNSLVQRLLFGEPEGSKTQAKDRLKTTLACDRLGFSPEQMAALRKDVLDAINRHVTIDTDRVKIDILQQRARPEMVINAPVRRVRPRMDAHKQPAG